MAFERKLVVPIIGDSRSFERAIKRSVNASKHFDSRMGRMSKGAILGLTGMATAATGLGVAFGVQSVKAAVSFETALSRIVGLAGQSQKQVKSWGEQLVQLGPKLGKSPQELAEALYFIASSGVPASKAMNTLIVSAKASAAGLGETQVVADAVTSVMNAYAGSNMTAARAADVLTATVREGKGEADEFAGVIGNIAAFSSRLKVPFESVGAALAAMTQLGTDPHTAAVQLSAFYSQILKVSAPMEKKAAKMGLGDLFGDLQQMLTHGNLLGALRMINSASSRGMLLRWLSCSRTSELCAPSSAYQERMAGRWCGIFHRMTHSAGSTKKAYGAFAKTSQHNFDVLSASLKALKIVFGQGLLPMVNRLAIALGKKFADPHFINRVRNAGKQLGAAFMRFGVWFNENWPAIKSALLATAGAITKIMSAAKWLDKHKGPSGMDIVHGITGAPGRSLVRLRVMRQASMSTSTETSTSTPTATVNSSRTYNAWASEPPVEPAGVTRIR